VDPLPPGPGPKDKMGTHLALKSQLLEPLFSFPAWGVGNIILIFPPTLSCHTKILALKKKKKKSHSQVQVGHICNRNYLGGWDWEDQGSKPIQVNSL
jgi:hypothetical protein